MFFFVIDFPGFTIKKVPVCILLSVSNAAKFEMFWHITLLMSLVSALTLVQDRIEIWCIEEKWIMNEPMNERERESDWSEL